jgi:hypothetical protein
LSDCLQTGPKWSQHYGCTCQKILVRVRERSDAIALNINRANNRAIYSDGENRFGFRGTEGSKPARISGDILDYERSP